MIFFYRTKSANTDGKQTPTEARNDPAENQERHAENRTGEPSMIKILQHCKYILTGIAYYTTIPKRLDTKVKL